MNIHVILQNLDASALNCIAAELDRYRTAHIVASEANYIVSATDQVNIIRYLRDFSLPGRPQSSEEIMRNFASSALSYHVMRDRLGAHVGGHPTPITITEALAREFDEPRFLESASWEPANLQTLALTVAHLNGWHRVNWAAERLPPASLVYSTTVAASSRANWKGASPPITVLSSRIWAMLDSMARPIRQVGPPLLADYLKNIGFHQFVKPDVHVLAQLPRLAELGGKLGPREAFLLGWGLAEKLGMPAFLLDQILYQWGRHGADAHTRPASAISQPQTLVQPSHSASIATGADRKLPAQPFVSSCETLLRALQGAAESSDVESTKYVNDGKHIKYYYRNDPTSNRRRCALMLKIGVSYVSVHLAAYKRSEIEVLLDNYGLARDWVAADENQKDQFDWKVTLPFNQLKDDDSRIRAAESFVRAAIARYCRH